MVTKQQLGSMQNYEIALLLCELLNYTVTFVHPQHESEMPTINVAGKTAGEWFAVEFGRWDCIMPLAVEYGIHFGPDGDIDNPTNHYAISDKSIASENLIEVVHSVPQRAIACCLILILQEKQNER